VDPPPSMTLTMDASQMVPAAFSFHVVRACATDCSTGMVVIRVPLPSAISVGDEGSGARWPKDRDRVVRSGRVEGPATEFGRRAMAQRRSMQQRLKNRAALGFPEATSFDPAGREPGSGGESRRADHGRDWILAAADR